MNFFKKIPFEIKFILFFLLIISFFKYRYDENVCLYKVELFKSELIINKEICKKVNYIKDEEKQEKEFILKQEREKKEYEMELEINRKYYEKLNTF